MQPFLEKTAKHIYTHYKDSLDKLCIVLPNRRGGLFLKRHLAKLSNDPLWMPDIYSSEDFIRQLSGLELLDVTDLLFELYTVHKELKPKDAESFENFCKWGQNLLSDFNEIDSYLVKGELLFKNLNQVKEMENWSLGEEELTDFQKQYLQFWESLGEYYVRFQKQLLSNKKAYQGLAYKVVSEKLQNLLLNHPWKKIIFAGFNALNKAEEEIIKNLLNTNKAEILWDADSYYVNNNEQEAGKFLRAYMNTLKTKGLSETWWLSDDLKTSQKNIHLIAVPKSVNQVKAAGTILTQLSGEQQNITETTALVLADETLLLPALHSLPDNINDVNVTMGFSMKNSALATLIEGVFQLQLNLVKFGKQKFYYKDVVKIAEHPFLYTKVKRNSEYNYLLAHIFITPIKLTEHYKDTGLHFLFEKWETIDQAANCLKQLIELLKETFINAQSKHHTIELEFLYQFNSILNRITDLNTKYGYIDNIQTLYALTAQLVGSTSVPFYGEPLKGLQIMGMLETRTLDFENLILVSANENILPSARSSNSFIPFDVKRVFGLPTHNDKDAIFAYHFYRLLQRAKNIYLLYNTQTDTFGKGEKSRFVTQLQYELTEKNSKSIIKNYVFETGEIKLSSPSVAQHKTEHTLNLLREKAEKGFSPSLLISYINCKLQFYFKAVTKLYELDEVEEKIGADTLGSVIHKTLEKLYTPYINKTLSVNDVKHMLELAEITTQESFHELYSKDAITEGKNLIAFKVAKNYIQTFLKKELDVVKNSTLQIVALEKTLNTGRTWNNEKINFTGNADRIDLLDQNLRIIDYKTGLTKVQELNPVSIEAVISDAKYNKSFQLLMYAWMLNPTVDVESGTISFRMMSKGLMSVTLEKNKLLNADTLKTFEHVLQQLINDIFNPALPFDQTTDLETCEVCAFKSICTR